MKKILLCIVLAITLLLSGCRTNNGVIDTEAPMITVNPHESEFYLEGVVPIISATCIDDTDETCFVSTPNYPDLSVHGLHTVTFVATDNAGNESIETLEINIIDRAEYIKLTFGPYNTTIELGDTYVFPTVSCSSTESATCTVEVPLTLDTSTVTGEISYEVRGSDDQGNTRIYNVIIDVVDTELPTIELTGEADITVELGGAWTDLGVTTIDLQTVVVTQDVTPDVNTVGVYTIIYTATDASSNTSTTQRVVNVVDTTVPIITLVGDITVNLVVPNTWVDPGVTTSDLQTVTVTQDITPDYNVVGTYVITYTATDASNNTSTVQRTVIVS